MGGGGGGGGVGEGGAPISSCWCRGSCMGDYRPLVPCVSLKYLVTILCYVLHGLGMFGIVVVTLTAYAICGLRRYYCVCD